MQSAEATPLPHARVNVEGRVVDVWCTFLDQLATNAEAALAAAIAYQELDATTREVWLASLEQDAARIRVPRIAVYAPLLAVETDPARRRRITQAMGTVDREASARADARGLCGIAPDGTRLGVIVSPLYLDFVQVLACAYRPAHGFSWVKHDPIVEKTQAAKPGDVVSGARLDVIPLKALVDELAVAVLAHRRSGAAVPEALCAFADLFSPTPAAGDIAPRSK